jgi:hypothetical protein
MSIEAMKQALEIIKNMRSGYGDDYPTEKERKTITDLRQAIEEAEKQEPVAWVVRDSIDGSWYPCAFENPAGAIKGESKPLYAVPQQAEKQEPVAWIQEDRIVPELGYDCTMTREHPKELGYTPLYSAPPRKEWVELNLDDIPDVFVGDISFCQGAKWAQAKLKEKNT